MNTSRDPGAPVLDTFITPDNKQAQCERRGSYCCSVGAIPRRAGRVAGGRLLVEIIPTASCIRVATNAARRISGGSEQKAYLFGHFGRRHKSDVRLASGPNYTPQSRRMELFVSASGTPTVNTLPTLQHRALHDFNYIIGEIYGFE
ncbi:unnamed protein product [Euphydryas editha]|uniref:Uncharacterized protein n=1 Tax=Euphydryas editha TaxID=104508 RepID=A0AAU9THD1_EUPED|nr:unnamed protein product [Euphydryas editha]